MRSLLFCVLATCALTASCMPFLVPPTRLRAGVGTPLPRAPLEVPAENESAGELSIGVHPTQLVRPHYAGPVDVGLGYHIEGNSAEHANVVAGPELELGFYPLRGRLSPNQRFRAGAFTELSILSADGFESRAGTGVTTGALFELTGFSESTFAGAAEDGAVAGTAIGQWAIGLYAAASYRSLESTDYFITTFGLTGRIPFLAGIVCCASPFASSGTNGSQPSSSSSSSSSSTNASRPRRLVREREPEPRRSTTPHREYHPAEPRLRPQN